MRSSEAESHAASSRVVKRRVCRLEVERRRRIARLRALELVPGSLERRQPLVVGPLQREAEHVRLEHQPGRVDVLHLAARDLADPRPALRAERDEPFSGQTPDRLAERRRADVPPGRELLDADSCAGRELARHDRRAQPRLGPLGPGCRLELAARRHDGDAVGCGQGRAVLPDPVSGGTKICRFRTLDRRNV